MSKKLQRIISIVIAILIFFISLSADILNIGGDPNAFGWKQIVGSIVGIIILVVGVLQRRKTLKFQNNIFHKVTP